MTKEMQTLALAPVGNLESYIRAANAWPMLTADEERALAEKLHYQGDLEAAKKLILSEILVLRLSSAVTEVAKVFGTQFELSGLSFDECLLLLLLCSMIGWVAAWLATVQHLRHFTPQ